jgi:hypothetical protein
MSSNNLHTQNGELVPALFQFFFLISLSANMPCQRAKIKITKNESMKDS